MKNRNNKWYTVYLSLGSNLGNRKANLIRAIRLLQKNPKFKVKKIASVYKSSPVGPKQRDFFNTALKAKTFYSPAHLLSALKKIEEKMGRKKTIHWGPRPIDLDIIFFGDTVLRRKNLTIPHPEFTNRKFVLAPLSEISPDFKPPKCGQTLGEIHMQLTDSTQKVKLMSSDFWK